MKDIEIQPIKKISRECLNCRTEFFIEPYVEQDFCNKCFPIVCKAVFEESNDNLTCKQLVEKLRLGQERMTENKLTISMPIQEDVLRLRLENEQLKNTIMSLLKQIEKMKCCYNCEGYIDDAYDLCKICNKHSEWELAEC